MLISLVSLLPLLSAPRWSWRELLLGLPLALASGCLGGQTGGEYDGDGGGEGTAGENPCRLATKPVSRDDASELGFAAEDVLAWALRDYSAVLSWAEPPSPNIDGSTSDLLLELRLGSGPILLRHWAAKPGSVASGAGLQGMCPPDDMAIPISVTLSTADGALAEQFETSLTSRAPSLAELSSVISAELVKGDFRPRAGEGYTLDSLNVEVSVYPGGTSGRVGATLQSSSSGQSPNSPASTSVGVAFRQLGTWPAFSPCGARAQSPVARAPVTVAWDAKVAGVSADSAVAASNEFSEAAWTWRDGATTRARFRVDPAANYACAWLPSQPPLEQDGSLDVPVTLSVLTADGLLNASWPAWLRATPGASGIARLNLEAKPTCARGAEPEGLSICGLRSLESTAYDNFKVQFTAQSQLEDMVRRSGTFEVAGERKPNCPNPMDPCPGISWDVLESAAFTDE